LSEWYEMVPFTPVVTGITFAFTFHMGWISIMRSLYFNIFPGSFLITFLSPGIATSIYMHVLCLLSRIMMSGLLLGIVLSVCTCYFMICFRLILVHGHTSVCCLILPLISLRMLQYSWAHILTCFFTYFSFASIGHAGMICSTVSSYCLQTLRLLSYYYYYYYFYYYHHYY